MDWLFDNAYEILFAVLAATFAFAGHRWFQNRRIASKRIEMLRNLASTLGGEFREQKPEFTAAVKKDLKEATLAEFHESRTVSGIHESVHTQNVLSFNAEWGAGGLFDYEQRTHQRHPRRGGSIRRTFFYARLTVSELPSFHLKPACLSFTFRQPPNFRAVDLKVGDQVSDRFTATYRLSGMDEAGVRRLFTSNLQDFILTRDNVCIEGRGRVLLISYDTSIGSSFTLRQVGTDGRIGLGDPEDLRQFFDFSVVLTQRTIDSQSAQP